MANQTYESTSGSSDLRQMAVRTLIHHGRWKGSVTRSDILDMIPDAEFDEEVFQQVIEQIVAAGVEYAREESGDTSPLEEFNEMALSLEETAAELSPGEDILAGIEADNMIRMYIKEAVQTPLLTFEQEKELAQWVEECRQAQEELSRGVTDSAQRERLQRIIERGQKARDRMIQANTRLVISVARHYRDRGLPLLDLIQEGNIGLMRAVRNYDYRRGFRFSTYATWWIRQAISRTLADQSRSIRLPAYLSDQINAMHRQQQRLEQKLGRPPTLTELAEAMSLSPARVEELMQVSRQPISLEAPLGEDEDATELGDLIGGSTPDPEESAIQAITGEEMRRRMEELPPRERQLLEMRFGLTGEEPMSLAEVGQRLGISRERARQIEAQALERLRNPGKRRRN